ncbi:MAG TPA: hypothetical protein VFG58_03850 [Solirubrobacterales bacterium]|nr:hypothetical protein [Solirubrobacterales bacterium]
MPTALVAFPVALPTAFVALPATSPAVAIGPFGELDDLLALLDLLADPRERAWAFFELPVRFAERFALV